MGWSVGYDENWKRDIGYGVPSICDHPNCNVVIDRGIGHVCGNIPYGGYYCCGLYFCCDHLDAYQQCERCAENKYSFLPKPDTEEWVKHKLTHSSWRVWRDENPIEVKKLKETTC